MYLKVTYDQDFYDLLMWLRGKYPKKLWDLDGIGKQTDMSLFSRDFFNTRTTTADVSVDDNSNVDDMSVIAYHTELPKPFFRLNSYYVLWKKLKQLYGLQKANNIVERQLTGDVYINDFHGIGGGYSYCFNYSTFDIMLNGLPMIKKIKSIAPKYLYSFKSQLEQFVIIASNSTLGATGLADLFIVMSHYVNNILENGHDAGFYFDGWFSDDEKMKIVDLIKDIPSPVASGETDKEIEFKCSQINEKLGKTGPANKEWFEFNAWKYVEENIASFIYTVNQPMRGNQSPFTNVSVYDEEFLKSLIEGYTYDGREPKLETVQELQELFIDIMNKEMERTPITFPVTTACFAVDEHNTIQDEKFLEMIAEKNLRYGFINIYCGSSSTLSSCCRLRSETNNEYFNSFGAGSTKIGSLGVATINFPRIAFKYQGDEEGFFEELRTITNDCARINHAKRKVVEKRVDNGNLPLYTLGFIDLSKQYSTTGVNGLNEALDIMGYNVLEKDGQDFLLQCLEVINECNDKNQKQYGAPHNCEQIPGESSSAKLARKDKLLKYQTEDNDYEIYSNQFIPLVTQADMLDRIKLQGLFDKHFSGGAIMHLNVDQQLEDPTQVEELIRSCAKKGVVYFAINYKLQKCENEHMTIGSGETCNECGAPITDEYTRVVGYLVNTKSFNKTRREVDYPNRQFYAETPGCLNDTSIVEDVQNINKEVA